MTGAVLHARRAKPSGGPLHDVSEMAIAQGSEIDRDQRGHIAAERAAPHLDRPGLLGDVARTAARESLGERQAVAWSLDGMPENRLGSQGRRAVRVGAVASTGQPP